MGLDYSMQLLMSGIVNVGQLVGVITSISTMDKFGRRALLLRGVAIMAICHIIVAILVSLYSDNWPAHRAQGWASVALLLVYMVAFGGSWGPVGWALPAGKYLTLMNGGMPLMSNSHRRGLSFFSPCQGCGPLDLFQLAEQFYYCEFTR